MSKLLIKNGFVVTMNPQRENLFADILIEDDLIKKIAKNIDDTADEVIDASEQIIIPGLIQSHVHLCQTLFRGLANDMDLMDWLDVIMPLESCHDEESAYISAKVGIAEMLKSGTTTINDMGTVYFSNETAEAVRDTGIRAQLGRTNMDKSDTDYLKHAQEKGLQEAEDFILKWHNKPGSNITCGLPIRWILTTQPDTFLALRDLALKYNVPIHTHANENVRENKVALEQMGMTAIDYFDSIGLTDAKMQIAHCIYLSPTEWEIIKKKDISVLHCPSCNLKAASGIAPVPELLRAGVNVSLGADTAACNDNLDPFTEMRLATVIQKPRLGATAIKAEDAFEMATIGGAKALQLDKQIGSLEPGKKADLVILRKSIRNAPFHYDRAISSLVYTFNGRDVDTTIVNGKVLVKGGELVTINESQLVKEANIAIRRVIKRAQDSNRVKLKVTG